MQLDLLSQQYTNFDVKMAWDITTMDSKTVIEGGIRNVLYMWMEDIEIRVDYPDANGKTVCRAADLIMPRQLNMNDTAPFRVILQTIVPSGAKLVFTYKYHGYNGSDGTNWLQSFEANVP